MIVVMVVTVSVLLAAHTSEVIVWSLAYAIIDAAPAGRGQAPHLWKFVSGSKSTATSRYV
jgi:hypothetical protein